MLTDHNNNPIHKVPLQTHQLLWYKYTLLSFMDTHGVPKPYMESGGHFHGKAMPVMSHSGEVQKAE